jgi:hypothetical protein
MSTIKQVRGREGGREGKGRVREGGEGQGEGGREGKGRGEGGEGQGE